MPLQFELVLAAALLMTVSFRSSSGTLVLDFGPGLGDRALDHCHDCCHNHTLPTPVHFFGVTYETIYVCSNGNLNFGEPNLGHDSRLFPTMGSDTVMIAIFFNFVTLRNDVFMDIIDDYVYADIQEYLYPYLFDDTCANDNPFDYPSRTRNCNHGLLEVYNGSLWGGVCDDNRNFYEEEATVACTSLGYSAVHLYSSSYVPDNWDVTTSVGMHDLDCDGTETSLFDCRHGTHRTCPQDDLVYINCYNHDEYERHVVDNDATIQFLNSISYVPNVRPDLVGNVLYRDCSRRRDVPAFRKVLKLATESGDVDVWDCFVATYYMVSLFAPRRYGVNSFQAIVGSATVAGEEKTGVVMAYETLQSLVTVHGNLPSAGFNDGRGNYFNMPGSMSADIADLVTLSNVDMPGVWAFLLDPGEGVSRCPSPPVVTPPSSHFDRQQTVYILGYCNATNTSTIQINIVGESMEVWTYGEMSGGSYIKLEMPSWGGSEQVTLRLVIDGWLNYPTIQYTIGPAAATAAAAPLTLLMRQLLIGIIVKCMLEAA